MSPDRFIAVLAVIAVIVVTHVVGEENADRRYNDAQLDAAVQRGQVYDDMADIAEKINELSREAKLPRCGPPN